MDNLKKKGPQDRSKINLNESWEKAYWVKALCVSPEILEEAVGFVGTGVDKVKQYLILNEWVDEGFYEEVE